MKFIGVPKQLVRFQSKLLKKSNRLGIRFDADGFYETENPRLIKALSRKFKTVSEVIEPTISIKTDLKSYKELQTMYAEKTGLTAVGVKKADILKILEETQGLG